MQVIYNIDKIERGSNPRLETTTKHRSYKEVVDTQGFCRGNTIRNRCFQI